MSNAHAPLACWPVSGLTDSTLATFPKTEASSGMFARADGAP
jgi:hypothetical protein